jgi:PPOX class probable F420-dependent enzyme
MVQSRAGWFPLLTLCLSGAASAQEAARATPGRAEVLRVARQVIQKARYATLVTVGEDGHPQARVVDPFRPEADMTVWLATTPRTRKVAQIARDPRVTLLYFDPAAPSYVTLLGQAELVRDPAERARRWKEGWAPFYKDRNRGDDYLLVKVTPLRVEVVSERDGIAGDPQTWRPAIVEMNQGGR